MKMVQATWLIGSPQHHSVYSSWTFSNFQEAWDEAKSQAFSLCVSVMQDVPVVAPDGWESQVISDW